jgi:hypothetical protein
MELARELQVVHGDGDVIEAAQARPAQVREPMPQANRQEAGLERPAISRLRSHSPMPHLSCDHLNG